MTTTLSHSNPLSRLSKIAVGSFFFLHGLCFSTWAVRIPDIQQKLNLSETELGTLLFALPVGSMLCLTFASQLISWAGTPRVLLFSALLYASTLAMLAQTTSTQTLGECLILFGIAGNLVNIAVNAQAVEVEKRRVAPIMAAFHGLWSLAGFLGATLGTGMMALRVSPQNHFLIIFATISLASLVFSQWLLPDSSRSQKKEKFSLKRPDPALLLLGIITFCSMVCEGTMFDWSGVYFEKVVQAKDGWVGAGYVAFMSTMAGTRFIADRLKTHFGFHQILQVCGLMIAGGLIISIIFPTLPPALLGFFLVGAGTSAVVPFTFSEAGRTGNRSAASAITTVSGIGFLGFLIGPPLIGWIAGAASLRISFSVIVLFALAITALVRRRAG